jgi:16S rRNA (guanine527-N7)-methyltransferase
MTLENILTNALRENNLACSEAQQQKLVQYLELMQRWNQVFNLTTITAPRDMVYLHLIDSLLMQPFLHGKRLLDVGSGAGLPGIPLAIMNPDMHWTLLDKNNKKTRFITQAAAELKLTNVTAIKERSEDYQATTQFDTILSRAYGTIEMFLSTTQHLLTPDGVFVAMKGKHPQDELDNLPPNFIVEKIVPIAIKGITVDRCVVMLGFKK